MDDLFADGDDAMRLIGGLFRRGETGEGFRERSRRLSLRVTQEGITSSAMSEEAGTAVRIRREGQRLLVARTGTGHEVLRSTVREAGLRNGSAPFFKASLNVKKEAVPRLGSFEQEAEVLAAGLGPILSHVHRHRKDIRFTFTVACIQTCRVVITPRRLVSCGLPQRLEVSGTIQYPAFQREFSFQSSLPLPLALPSFEEALEIALAAQTSGVPSPGEADVVFAPEAAAAFWHEAIGHALEAGGGEAASLLARVPGAAVGPVGLDISDVPSSSGMPGSYVFDDEGAEGTTTPLIEKGRVAGLLTDGQTGGPESNGHGRTPDFRRVPQPRMSNLLVSGGTVPLPELLSQCGGGVFVRAVSFGTADPESGRFILHAEEGSVIRKGKLSEPLSHFALHGYVLHALQNLEPGLGNEVLPAPGLSICIKRGDPLPVGGAAPAMLIRGMSLRPLRK